MNKYFFSVIAVIIAVAVYFAFQTRMDHATPVTMEVPVPAPSQTPAAVEPPSILFPVPEPIVTETEPVEPLPELDQSDESVEQKFNQLVENNPATDLLLFQTFIRNFVVITDNLTADKLPQQYLFFRPPAGAFMTTPVDDERSTLNPANYNRYTPFIRLVESIDLDRLVNIYSYLYPLFQQAYEELGYPDSYFNDRVIETINHILESPEVSGPVVLEQPNVYYTFADPTLEALSAGQKLLIRVGPDNAAVIRIRLQELLAKLTTLN